MVCAEVTNFVVIIVTMNALPPREANMVPWHEVAVDLIRLRTMLVHSKEMEFNAFICIDPVSNIVEIARIENKSATHVSIIFENIWLTRYPKPDRCAHNNGGEFIGTSFSKF
jgi:hypothetical protein